MARGSQQSRRGEAPSVIGVGFLLSQLGMHAATSFASRLAPHGLTPPQVGLLRAIGLQPGRSQQAIAEEFGLPPSRMVAFVDALEEGGLVERRRDSHDRRVHLLHLTAAGRAMLERLAGVARAADEALLASLAPAERAQLAELLTRVVADQGLTQGVHPGYRRLKPDTPTC